jgi:uncharacterized protein (DUF342 family)
MTQLSLVSNKKNNVDLVISPIKSGDAVTEVTIQELIAKSEFSALHISTSNIKNALAELNDVLKNLAANDTGREIIYQILDRQDATISITIESDEMSATAEITTAVGGKNFSAKSILSSAQESGVKKGFSKEELIKLAQVAAKEPPGSVVSLKIAEGRIAKNGKDAKIKHLVESAQTRILRPKRLENGSVDMRDLGDIICVKVGDFLAQKIPFTQGKEGYTVTATPLAPEPGSDIDLTPGEGTSLSPKNDLILISELIGLPKIIDNGMEVDEIYKVKDVDVSTGHIKFEGSVIISGNVCEGMKVHASGDITIAGFVESATLDAGGDITVSGGIIGRKQDIENEQVTDLKMSVSITAKGKLFAKHCQYAEINTGSDTRIENQLMHCLLDVGGDLWVGTEEKANGKLIGGAIKVSNSVRAGIIGATAGSNTTINFERPIVDFSAVLAEIDERFQLDSTKTDELKALMAKLKKLPKDEKNTAMLGKVTTTYQFHANRMGQILVEKDFAEEKLQDYMASVYVEATDKLHHGVELIIGKYNDRTRREYGPSRMCYKERKIIIDAITHT